MAKEDVVIVKMVAGSNYLGRGYHFKKGDVADMTKAEAKPFLKIKAGKKPMFAIVDPDLEDIPDEVEVPVEDPVQLPQGNKVVKDPRNISDPKELRQWLKEHSIAVVGNPSLDTMKGLIPEDVGTVLGLGSEDTEDDSPSDEDIID